MRAGRWGGVVALGLIVGLITPVQAAPLGTVDVAAEATSPNVLLILTDDQRAGTEVGMPTVMSEIAAKGTTYSQAVVPTSWCCPSRASLLTGKFAHNTGVWQNTSTSAWGAWSAFAHGGEEADTLATRLHGAGYRTGLFGKYLNGLKFSGRDYVPPGWDAWSAFLGGTHTRYRLSSDDGPYFVDRPYLTDALADQAVDFISSTPSDQPVFTYFAPYAPHHPFTPGPYAGSTRAAGLLEDVRAAARFPSPATNQADMTGYPQWMQGLPPSETWYDDKRPTGAPSTLDEVVEHQADMLMGVDAAISRMLDALRQSGRLENTVIVFMSDNGFAWGEHRLQGKNTPYDVSVRVPLVMRYDGVLPAGVTDRRVLAANVDVHATILDLVGVQAGEIDGVSVRRAPRDGVVMEAMTSTGTWRRPAYCGYRTEDHLYVRYASGEEELYDYARDPHELTNVAANPVYGTIRNNLEGQARRACSPTPPGFTWDDAPLPITAPTNVETRRVGRSGVIVTWRAPASASAPLPMYEVYVGSTRGLPACVIGSGGLSAGLRCRVEIPPGRAWVSVTVVAVSAGERASAWPKTVLRRSPRAA